MTLHRFRALRPPSNDAAAALACVPYDVVSSDEARAMLADAPASFLRVVRPEATLPAGTDEHADAVYAAGAEHLAALVRTGDLTRDATPGLYAYRLGWRGRAMTGLFACVAVADYDAGRIVRHELTRPDKEDDRTRHLLAQAAHAEPVMLAFRDDARLGALLAAVQSAEPLYDFDADAAGAPGEAVRHTLWRFSDAAAAEVQEAFAAVPALYVADGHHRCKAASRAYHALADAGTAGPDNPGGEGVANEAAFFPAALFPVGEMRILPYHRVVAGVPETFEADLRARFAVVDDAPMLPERAGDVSVYLGDGRWAGLTLPDTASDAVADRLDVARLAEHVLAPLLGVTDARTDARLGFVGGIRGPEELARRVDDARADGQSMVAFAMYPTQMHELLAVSDAAELMPPKSTWFEPKLRSGLLVHTF